MDGREDGDVSRIVCGTLDHLGFKKETILLRSKSSEEYAAISNLITNEANRPFYITVPAGSFAEGVQLCGSDVDFMIVYQNALCLDHGDICEHLTIMEVDPNNTSPGYTRLVSKHKIKASSTVSAFLRLSQTHNNTIDTYPYISSSKFRRLCNGDASLQFEVECFEDRELDTFTSGPALTCKATFRDLEFDYVFAFYYYGGNYLSRWAKRARHYTWPSDDIVKEISEMEGYVVPVGDKQSEYQNLEWRICFTTAEKKLVSKLDGIQLKLYVLLKLLAKHILKPVCKAVTSYVMKNVVFWISETTHVKSISPDNFMQLLLKSLHFLKSCFENNHLPNYMIEERNLLRGAVCVQEKRAIISLLSECLKERSRILLWIPHFCQYLNIMLKTPESMAEFGSWRQEMEKIRATIFLERAKEFEQALPCTARPPADLPVWKPTFTISQFQLVRSIIPECFNSDYQGKTLADMEKLFLKRIKSLTLL